jgi:hypothetical protein
MFKKEVIKIRDVKKQDACKISDIENVKFGEYKGVLILNLNNTLFSTISNIEEVLGYNENTLNPIINNLINMGVVDTKTDFVVLFDEALKNYKNLVNDKRNVGSPVFINLSSIISAISQLHDVKDENKKAAIKYLKDCSDYVLNKKVLSISIEEELDSIANKYLDNLDDISTNNRKHQRYLKDSYGVNADEEFLLHRSRIFEKARRAKYSGKPGAYTLEEADMLERQAQADIVKHISDNIYKRLNP